eukprot:s597_g21.t4
MTMNMTVLFAYGLGAKLLLKRYQFLNGKRRDGNQAAGSFTRVRSHLSEAGAHAEPQQDTGVRAILAFRLAPSFSLLVMATPETPAAEEGPDAKRAKLNTPPHGCQKVFEDSKILTVFIQASTATSTTSSSGSYRSWDQGSKWSTGTRQRHDGPAHPDGCKRRYQDADRTWWPADRWPRWLLDAAFARSSGQHGQQL